MDIYQNNLNMKAQHVILFSLSFFVAYKSTKFAYLTANYVIRYLKINKSQQFS